MPIVPPAAVNMPAVVNVAGAVMVRVVAPPELIAMAEVPVALMMALSPRKVRLGVEIVRGRAPEMV